MLENLTIGARSSRRALVGRGMKPSRESRAYVAGMRVQAVVVFLVLCAVHVLAENYYEGVS